MRTKFFNVTAGRWFLLKGGQLFKPGDEVWVIRVDNKPPSPLGLVITKTLKPIKEEWVSKAWVEEHFDSVLFNWIDRSHPKNGDDQDYYDEAQGASLLLPWV